MARCEWQYPWVQDLFGYRCPREAGPLGSLCILHDPDPAKDQREFREALEGKKLAGDYDFRGVVFVGEFRITGSVQNADFSWAKFLDLADFTAVRFEAGASFLSARFSKTAAFVDTTFESTATFCGALFEDRASFVYLRFLGNTFFDFAVFKGIASFEGIRFARRASFSHSEFNGEASLSDTHFSDDANFGHTKFLSNTYFASSTFQGEARFVETIFKGHAVFTMAKFGGKAARRTYFLKSAFSGDASFQYATFTGGVFFKDSTFYGACTFRSTILSSGNTLGTAANFKNVRFDGTAYFDELFVYGYMNFDHVEFAKAAFLRGPFHPARIHGDENPVDHLAYYAPFETYYTLFTHTTVPMIEFTNALLERAPDVHFEKLDLTSTSFKGTNIRKVTFYDVEWPRAIGRKLLAAPGQNPSDSGLHLPRSAARSLYRQIEASLARQTVADEFGFGRVAQDGEKARQQCRDLKANLEDQRDYADAGDFYFSEMELRRRALLRRGPAGWLPWLLHSLYWLTSGYGERIFRSAVAFLILWLSLAGVFTLTWFRVSEPVNWRVREYEKKYEFRPTYSESVSYTFRSLTFQRGGYMVPFTPWAERLTLLANVLGPTQLGFLFLAVRRRFWR